MVYLSKFRPTDVRPELLVDRSEEAEWLEHSIQAYLGDRDPEQGQGFCVLGAKGVGKSILTRKVLDELKQFHAPTTLFVEVDCRGALRQRKVLKQIVEQVHAELYTFAQYGSTKVSKELVASAAVLKTLAGFDEVERRTVHEHLTEFRAAAIGASSPCGGPPRAGRRAPRVGWARPVGRGRSARGPPDCGARRPRVGPTARGSSRPADDDAGLPACR